MTGYSFVMLQEVMQVLEDPMPLEEYLDALIDVWKRGAFANSGKRR